MKSDAARRFSGAPTSRQQEMGVAGGYGAFGDDPPGDDPLALLEDRTASEGVGGEAWAEVVDQRVDDLRHHRDLGLGEQVESQRPR